MEITPECGDELEEQVLEPTNEEVRDELVRRLTEGEVSGVEKTGAETVIFYDDDYCGRIQVQDKYWNETQKAEITASNPERVEAVLRETSGDITYYINS